MAIRRCVLAWVATVHLGGCATIFSGTKDTLTFAASVPSVRLTVDGEYLGELPLTVEMSRSFVGGRQFVARFEKPGYVTQEFRLKREFNAVAILDITSIPVSGGVDVLTGALMKFSPTDYHVQMLKEGQAAGSPEFRRAAAIYGFALANYRNVQKDLARGGGEHLGTLAALLGGGEAVATEVARQETIRNAPLLLAARSAHDFVACLARVLAGKGGLAPLES